MQKIANLFLILFLIAAGFGLGSALLRPTWPDNPLAGPHNLVNLLLVLLAVPVYFGFGFKRQLSKLIFVPLLGYLFWGLLDYWPLESLTGNHYRLYAACGQLLLGLLALQLIHRENRKSPLLVSNQFTEPRFSGRNFFFFCLFSIPLLPLALLLLSYSAASTLIEQNTAGFVRLKLNGLYMTEKIYTRGEKEIRLVGMIHLGQQAYYQELATSFNAGNSLLLAEGVSDTQGLMAASFSYGNLAELLGLTAQEQFNFIGRLIEAEHLDQPSTSGPGRLDILRADIDVQQFDPRTIEVLNTIGSKLLSSSTLYNGYRDFSQWAEQHVTPELNRIVMDDLVQKRNRSVLSYLPKGLQHYRTLIIPWGALHMPGIEAAIKQQGFALQEYRERLSINFLLLPYGQWWSDLLGD